MRNSNHHSYIVRHYGQSKAVSDLRGGVKEQLSQGGQMVSIIEYSVEKKARNSYPHRIISPPIPSQCCQARMNRIGQVQVEDNGKFYYKRCSRCGFTVREFMSAIDIERLLGMDVAAWGDRTESWLDRIQHEVETERAA